MTVAPPLSRGPVSRGPDTPASGPGQPQFIRTGQTWFLYGMLGAFAFLQAVLGPLMPFLRATLHVSYAVASLHFSAFALGATFAGVFSGRAARVWGRAGSIVVGAGGMAFGTLLVISGVSAVLTVVGALLMGLLGVLMLNSVQAMLMEQGLRDGSARDDSDGRSSAGAVALVEANVGASLCAILSAVVVGVVAGITWRLAVLPALLAFAVLARYRGVLRRGGSVLPHAPSASHTDATTGLPSRFWVWWAVIVLETAAEWICAYWGASLLLARGSLTPGAAAAAMSAFFLAMLIARFVGSRLLRTMRGGVVVAVALGIALIGFPLFWLAALPVFKVLGLFCVGLGLGNAYPVCVGLASAGAPARTDAVMARIAMGTGLAVLVAPFVLGVLADRVGIAVAFGVALPLLLAALLCTLVLVVPALRPDRVARSAVR